MTPGTASPRPRTTRQDEASGAAQWVRGMFGRIAPRYDLLNHLLSFNLDKRWRARTVARVAEILDRPDAQVLDLCCGTGDVAVGARGARDAGPCWQATSAIPC